MLKKDSNLRIINSAIKINKYTIKDTNLPLLVDNFLEQYTRCKIIILIDLFSRYN